MDQTFFYQSLILAQTIFCQTFKHSKTILDVYICQIQLFCVIQQDFYHLVSILANIKTLLMSNLCHLANTLINLNNILKVDLCYLASILININDKMDNFIREKVDCVQPIAHFLSA